MMLCAGKTHVLLLLLLLLLVCHTVTQLPSQKPAAAAVAVAHRPHLLTLR
jgi:hypothetical protein